MGASKILREKTAEEIQHPTPKPFDLGGETFPILPMPDGTLVYVAKEIGTVSSLLKTLTDQKTAARTKALDARRALGEELTLADVQEAHSFNVSDFKVGDLADLLPAIVQILLPSATKIIAASLRQPESWVQDTLFYRDRLRALRLILEAEDIPLLMGEFEALTAIFQPTTPSPGPEPTT